MSEPRPSDQDHDDNETSPLSQAWEMARYAPIGLVMEGPFLLPKLAQMGKAHVRNAQVLGRLAVRQGEAELRRRVADMDSHVVALLRLVGLLPAPDETTERIDATAEAEGPMSGDKGGEARGGDGPTHRPAASPTAGGPAATVPHRSGSNVEDLAIPDYDSLSASQVVKRLSGLRPDELTAVGGYELAHRGRKTILNKVAQLQA